MAIPLAEIGPYVIHPVEGITIAALVERFDTAARAEVRQVGILV